MWGIGGIQQVVGAAFFLYSTSQYLCVCHSVITRYSGSLDDFPVQQSGKPISYKMAIQPHVHLLSSCFSHASVIKWFIKLTFLIANIKTHSHTYITRIHANAITHQCHPVPYRLRSYATKLQWWLGFFPGLDYVPNIWATSGIGGLLLGRTNWI